MDAKNRSLWIYGQKRAFARCLPHFEAAHLAESNRDMALASRPAGGRARDFGIRAKRSERGGGVQAT
jgi:hypothetical protein